MQLQIDRAPMTRGVSHLMYVGDDQAVENAVGTNRNELIAGAVAAVVALQSRGVTRMIAGGIAAVIGIRALQSR